MTDHAATLANLSQHPHVLHNILFDGADYNDPDIIAVDTVESANAFSSLIATGGNAGEHTIAIDLDVPAVLVPSSTPGHSHLYIDSPMSWDAYLAILKALGAAGVIEDGYVAASERRGFTTLRLPWIKKETDADLDARLVCVGCNLHPSQLDEYVRLAASTNMSPARYCYRDEGTLNRRTGRFRCTACYIAAGMPSGKTP